MNFFNFNKKTIWILIVLILISILTYYINQTTIRIGACEGCPPIEQSTLNKVTGIAIQILAPIFNYQHNTSKIISYMFGYRETDVTYNRYGDVANILSTIIVIFIEIIYLYILACIINKIIESIKVKDTNKLIN